MVKPAAPDPRTTTLVAPPPATVLCGRPFTLQMIARDRWGNLCVNGPPQWQPNSAAGPSSSSSVMSGTGFGAGGEEQPSGWILADGQKGREMAHVQMVEPGKYALSLTPVLQGRNMAHVCWAGMHVKGSPFQLKALPAPPHASSYKLTYKPRSWPLLSAGVRFKLRVQAHDRFGNVYTDGIPPPRIFLLGTGATLSSPSPPKSPPRFPPPMTPLSSAGGVPSAAVPKLGGGGGGRSNGSRYGATPLPHAPALPPSPISPRALPTEETLATRLRSQLLSDFGLGNAGRPLPEEWARLLDEVDLMNGSAIDLAPGGSVAYRTPMGGRAADDGGSSARAALTLAGKVQKDPSLSISANLRDPEAIAPEAVDELVTSSQRFVNCEVTDLAHGVYEVTGMAKHAGTYQLCLRLPQRTPSAVDPMGGSRSLDSGASVTALSTRVGLSARLTGGAAAEVAQVVENEIASAVAMEEAHGVLCAEVRVLAGAISPSACTLSGSGLSLAHENERAYFELLAIDTFGNAQAVGGERFELRAYRLLPAGQRKYTVVEYEVSDCGDGRYTAEWLPTTAGRWEISLVRIPRKVCSPSISLNLPQFHVPDPQMPSSRLLVPIPSCFHARVRPCPPSCLWRDSGRDALRRGNEPPFIPRSRGQQRLP